MERLFKSWTEPARTLNGSYEDLHSVPSYVRLATNDRVTVPGDPGQRGWDEFDSTSPIGPIWTPPFLTLARVVPDE